LDRICCLEPETKATAKTGVFDFGDSGSPQPSFAPLLRMATVFLTGGTGFIGSHVAKVFLARGWRVRALVRRPERPGLLPGGVDVVPGDLSALAAYRKPLEGCTAVVHCAGTTRARGLAEYRRVNVEGTEAIARAAAAACPEAMFVHVSSQAAVGPSRNGRAVREGDAPAPVSWYGRSKLEARWLTSRRFAGA
jgi:nucleoside-diphosphate-sugar epimerase